MLKPIDKMTRRELADEFLALFTEARKRGDTRPRIEIFNEWLEFRKQSTEEKK